MTMTVSLCMGALSLRQRESEDTRPCFGDEMIRKCRGLPRQGCMLLRLGSADDPGDRGAGVGEPLLSFGLECR